MKNFILAFLVMCGINIISAQNIVTEVIYKKKSALKLDNNKKDISKSTSDSYNIVNSATEKMEAIEYTLIFDDFESNFEMKKSLDSDNDQDKISKLIAQSMGIGNGKYYTNRKTEKITHQKEFSSDLFLIESQIDSNNWELSKEKKKIGKYDCYKAKTITHLQTVRGAKEIPVTAWYTTEIPLPYGPANFVNLPGLVLELELNNVIIYAKEININKKANIIALKKGIKITEEEYVQLQKDGFNKYKRQ